VHKNQCNEDSVMFDQLKKAWLGLLAAGILLPATQTAAQTDGLTWGQLQWKSPNRWASPGSSSSPSRATSSPGYDMFETEPATYSAPTAARRVYNGKSPSGLRTPRSIRQAQFTDPVETPNGLKPVPPFNSLPHHRESGEQLPAPQDSQQSPMQSVVPDGTALPGDLSPEAAADQDPYAKYDGFEYIGPEAMEHSYGPMPPEGVQPVTGDCQACNEARLDASVPDYDDSGNCIGADEVEDPFLFIPVPLPHVSHVEVLAGVQGFKGPVDFVQNGGNLFAGNNLLTAERMQNGNFGLNGGINVAGPLPLLHCINYQLGYRGVHSNLNGTLESDIKREQDFVTLGFFNRGLYGVKWGIAYDWLRDEARYNLDLEQFRFDVSLSSGGCHEWGIAGALGTDGEENLRVLNRRLDITVRDQVFVYYRRHFGCNEGRLWLGLSDDGGVFGADTRMVLSPYMSLAAGFNYITPDDDDPPLGTAEESWNVGLTLIIHLYRRGPLCASSKPMFEVADNGSMMTRWDFSD